MRAEVGSIPGERTEESDGGIRAARALVDPRISRRQRGRPEERVQGPTVDKMGAYAEWSSLRSRQAGQGRVPPPLLKVLSDRQHKQRTTKSPPTSPRDHAASVESCRQLKVFIEGKQTMALFVCGGIILCRAGNGNNQPNLCSSECLLISKRRFNGEQVDPAGRWSHSRIQYGCIPMFNFQLWSS